MLLQTTSAKTIDNEK